MKRWNFSNVMLIVGLLFIYLPMLILVIYSFNASKLVTVWGGWSVKWYVGLLDNTQLVNSVGRSLEIAFYTAFSSVLLGTLAAFVLTRIPRFRGRTLFGGMVTAPLVMPEVITGLSLLLLFVAMAQLIGWPQERGIVTIWIAHTSFCSSYVAVVVSARLRELDLSIEEAAMDLGAKPWKVFLLITIPMIAPLAGGGRHDVLRPVAGRPGTGQLRLRPRLDHLADGSVLGGTPGREAGDQRGGQPDPAERFAVHLLRLVLHPPGRGAASPGDPAGDGRDRDRLAERLADPGLSPPPKRKATCGWPFSLARRWREMPGYAP